MNITNTTRRTYSKKVIVRVSISIFFAFALLLSNSGLFGTQNEGIANAESSCFTDSEMNQFQSEKKSIEDSLYDENIKLEAIETEIVQVSKEYNNVSDEIETLRRDLITEDILNKIKNDVDTLRNKLLTLNSDTGDQNTGVCSAPGYFDKNSCENASGPVGGSCTVPWNTDEQSCITDGYFEGGWM